MKLKVNVIRLTVALTLMLLLINSPITLKAYFLAMTHIRPNHCIFLPVLPRNHGSKYDRKLYDVSKDWRG